MKIIKKIINYFKKDESQECDYCNQFDYDVELEMAMRMSLLEQANMEEWHEH